MLKGILEFIDKQMKDEPAWLVVPVMLLAVAVAGVVWWRKAKREEQAAVDAAREKPPEPSA